MTTGQGSKGRIDAYHLSTKTKPIKDKKRIQCQKPNCSVSMSSFPFLLFPRDVCSKSGIPRQMLPLSLSLVSLSSLSLIVLPPSSCLPLSSALSHWVDSSHSSSSASSVVVDVPFLSRDATVPAGHSPSRFSRLFVCSILKSRVVVRSFLLGLLRSLPSVPPFSRAKVQRSPPPPPPN